MAIEDAWKAIYDGICFYDPITEEEIVSLLPSLIDDHIVKKERNVLIFKMHYGLDGFNKRTLTPIAKEFGVSRSTVRQVALNLLRQIRRKIIVDRWLTIEEDL